MNVKDVMVPDVSACRPGDSLAECAATMWISRCHELPVVDSRGRAIGVITNQDICNAKDTMNRHASEILVKDVSLPSASYCKADDDVRLALKAMVSQNVPRIPVVDHERKVVGMLSITDLLLRSEEQAGKLGISHEDLVNAATSILKEDVPEAVTRRT